MTRMFYKQPRYSTVTENVCDTAEMASRRGMELIRRQRR